MKTIVLNGVTFEVSKKALNIESVRYMGRNLDECYAKPSIAKRNIWEYWCRYFRELTNPVGSISLATTHPFINSYNSHTFTIGCDFIRNGTRYKALITPAHNYIYVTSI